MKKIASVICLFTILMSFFACDFVLKDTSSESTSQVELKTAVELVDEKIINLERPTSRDSYKRALEVVEQAYEDLSDSEKKQVSNYSLLVNAREVYNYLCMKEKAEGNIKYIISYNLLNPESLQVHSCVVTMYKVEDEFYINAYIDYSAQNRMGGYSRKSEDRYYKWNKENEGLESVGPFDFLENAMKGEVYDPKWLGD